MPEDKDTNLSKRVDAIENNMRKLRRDTTRMAAITTSNRAELERALGEVDELLYAALARGHEITPGNAPPPASAEQTDPPRCTHPSHDAEPPEARPAATHRISLRSPHAKGETAHAPLQRCAACAAEALKSPSAPRLRVTKIGESATQTGAPRCQSPVHLESELPAATTVIVTAGVRPGIRYCDACAEKTKATLERHRIPCESVAIVSRERAHRHTAAGRR